MGTSQAPYFVPYNSISNLRSSQTLVAHIPVILATQEAEIKRIEVQTSPGK
jgi:hypothetical protein